MVLLGDGEFDGAELLGWIEQHTEWSFAIRTGKNILLSHGEKTFQYKDFAFVPDSKVLIHKVGFTSQKIGPLQAVVWWGKGHKEPLYLVSNMDDLEQICASYRKRFGIETLFCDQKSRGFGMDKSHCSDPTTMKSFVFGRLLGFCMDRTHWA